MTSQITEREGQVAEPQTTPGAHVDPAALVTVGPVVTDNPVVTENPVVPVQTRSERPRSYEPGDFGVPTGREVNWKHTPLDRVRGVFEPAAENDGLDYVVASGSEYLSNTLPMGVAPRGEFFEPEDLPAAIAWQGTAEATHIRIPRETEVSEPVVLEITGSGSSQRGDAHIVIEAEAHAKATVVLRHRGSAQYAQNVEVIARDGSHLTVISVQQWDDTAVHLSTHQCRVDRDATLRHVVVSFGGGVVRVNPTVELAGQGAVGEVFGLAFADDGQHLESQVYLHHKGAQTTGDVLYKGALQGETARSVWIGDVLIGPDATGTDSYEANRNLVLTNGARADSIPNLEIETGDIAGAGHASATGRFDDEQLFYLQARGIDEEEARRLVVLGFLNEIAQKITVEDLQAELVKAIEEELAAGVPA